jgi:hypothetical protein
MDDANSKSIGKVVPRPVIKEGFSGNVKTDLQLADGKVMERPQGKIIRKTKGKSNRRPLEENWEYENLPDSSRPLPILYSYFHYTFERLQHEGKVLEVETNKKLAAFNTGLVDRRYEPYLCTFHSKYETKS